MTRQVRALEELITLQDKAITALQMANQALQIALDAVQAARAELGFKQPFPGFGPGIGGSGTVPYINPYSIYTVPAPVPNTSPSGTFVWGGSNLQGSLSSGAGINAFVNTAEYEAKVNTLVTQSSSQVQAASSVLQWLDKAGWKDPDAILSVQKSVQLLEGNG